MRWRWWSWAEKVSAAAATAGSRKETVFVYFPYFSDAEHQSRQLAIDNSISTSYSYRYIIAAATEGPTTPSRQTRHLTIRPSNYPSIDPILTRFLSRTPLQLFFFPVRTEFIQPNLSYTMGKQVERVEEWACCLLLCIPPVSICFP